MKLKLKKQLSIIVATLSLLVPVAVPAAAFAYTAPTTGSSTGSSSSTATATDCSKNNIATQVGNGIATATGNGGCGSGSSITGGVKSIAIEVVNILSIVVGLVAVIMIIYAGLRYVTSGGESGGVTSAKNSLLYAIVGLVLVALAQFIVRWVLNTSVNIGAHSTVSGVISLLHLIRW